MKNLQKDHMNVRIYDDRAAMGAAAAQDIGDRMKKLLETRPNIRMIFASAPSQNEFLAGLAARTDIDFSRVTAFHMDEYIGISLDAPQAFGKFLKDRLFSKTSFGEVHYMNSAADDQETECKRYADLLQAAPIDIAILGIGENAHIAFNDPPVADFNDPKIVKIVELDAVCRQQQVNDGCFATLDDVPRTAITITCPGLMQANQIICIAPTPAKANAIYHTLEGEVSTQYPSSIVRTKSSTLYLDPGSAQRIHEVSNMKDLG